MTGLPLQIHLAHAHRGLRAILPTWPKTPVCKEWRVTLDWLFLGIGDGLPHGTYIRLMAAMGAGAEDQSQEAAPASARQDRDEAVHQQAPKAKESRAKKLSRHGQQKKFASVALLGLRRAKKICMLRPVEPDRSRR